MSSSFIASRSLCRRFKSCIIAAVFVESQAQCGKCRILEIDEQDKETFERAYVANELLAQSWLAAAHGLTQQANQLIHFSYQANPKDRWIAYALTDNMFLSLAQAREHGLSEKELQKILRMNYHVEAARALWRIERREGAARLNC